MANTEPLIPVTPPAPEPDAQVEHHALAWGAGWRNGWKEFAAGWRNGWKDFEDEAYASGNNWPPFRRGWQAGMEAARLAAEGGRMMEGEMNGV